MLDNSGLFRRIPTVPFTTDGLDLRRGFVEYNIRPSVEASQQDVEALLQRIMRAAAIRRVELDIQWAETERWLTLVLRWRKKTLKVGFLRQDLPNWPKMN